MSRQAPPNAILRRHIQSDQVLNPVRPCMQACRQTTRCLRDNLGLVDGSQLLAGIGGTFFRGRRDAYFQGSSTAKATDNSQAEPRKNSLNEAGHPLASIGTRMLPVSEASPGMRSTVMPNILFASELDYRKDYN